MFNTNAMTNLTGMTDQGLEELLVQRHSVRAFTDDPVPREVIERLLMLAQRAASWCNTQPWEVIVTEAEATDRFRAALIEHVQHPDSQAQPDVPAPSRYDGVYRERRRESGWQLYDAVGVARGDREASGRQAMRNFTLFDAPHVAILTVDAAHGPYAYVDSGLYVGTFLLAAQSLGLGAIPQAALAMYAPFIRDYFSIPEDRTVLLGISFGYSDTEQPANTYRTNRASLDETIRWVK